jgi:hypothetical protein
MSIEQRNCRACSQVFPIPEEDKVFYRKIEVSAPTHCPQCRLQRRLAFRNEHTLYSRKCDMTGQDMVSMYKPESPFPVYSHEAWYGDEWDARDYGRDFDFNRPFFDQFVELRNEVPHLALISHKNENCGYCNIVGTSKNCYLLYGSVDCEDCYYGNPFASKDCCDSLTLRNSELCLECTDSTGLYNCYKCQNCENSRDLMFCLDVKNSANCFACVGLNRKEYCIFNKQYFKEEYERIVNSMDLKDSEQLNEILHKFNQLKRTVPRRSYIGVQNEDVSGNYIFNSKNAHEVYNAERCWDVKHGYQLIDVKDSMDLNQGEEGELLYEVMGFYEDINRLRFCYLSYGAVSESTYCGMMVNGVSNCFGSVGMKKAKYCILNKQYTKEEYEVLVPKIIAHMKETGEWGEFFPVWASPFAYNESVAMDLFPLLKEEVARRGWNWHEAEEKSNGASEDVCEVMDKAFRVIPQEEKFYERFNVSRPQRCPEQRHLDRLALRNPIQLWDRSCSKCSSKIQSSYAPDRSERVYCESCYLTEMY